MTHLLKSEFYLIKKIKTENIIGLFLCLAPVFAVTIRGWTSSILILGSFICLIYLITKKNEIKVNSNNDSNLLIITAVLPVISIIISSFFRKSFHLPDFDSPIRFLIAIPILIFIYRTKFNALKFLQFTIPAALIVTIVQQYTISQPMRWGTERMATYFCDPLVFGYTSFAFSIICLASINVFWKSSLLVNFIKITSVIIGFYLSIKSGSRTGWLALPFIMVFLLIKNNKSWKYTSLATILTLTLVAIFVIYLTSGTVNSRVNLTINEIAHYTWTGIAPETSVGYRITFLRIAWDLFFQSPWVGFGDTKFELPTLPMKIYGYASQEAIFTAFASGFHNEIITNSIRSGILGIISSFLLFAMPFFILIKKINSKYNEKRANATIGIVFIFCIFISSLSTEVFDLKATASLYSIMIALLCGSAISDNGKPLPKIRNLLTTQ